MSEENKVDGRYTCTSAVRMPFGNLIIPKAVGRKGKAKGEPKYSGTFTFEPDAADLKALKAKAAAVAKARWPGRALSELKFPFTDGNKKIEKGIKQAQKEGKTPRDQSFFKDLVVVDARSKYEPQLAVLKNGVVEAYENDKRALAGAIFYNGCYVVPSLNFVAYEGQAEDGVGNPDGVTAYLEALLWVKDGPKIGGTTSAAETFSGWAGTVTDENPGTDKDDEISF